MSRLLELQAINAQDGWRMAGMRERFAALADRKPWQTFTADQLFPTPRPIAERMARMAGLRPGHLVLEPSAGTGRLIEGMRATGYDGPIDACEIHEGMARALTKWDGVRIVGGDFLALAGQWDRIVMNPPFRRGLDARHILHARSLLAPGGRIVALAYDGAACAKHLAPIASTIERLPAGSFREAGTEAGIVLLTIES